jgi:C4-dicarboxylate-specific signal transduction histidine kinase
VMPLIASGNVHGVVSFHMERAARAWREETIAQMRLVAELLANALARKRVEDALRASELMKSAILSSLSSHVAVLDRDGTIIAANESWMDFVRQLGGSTDQPSAVGADYIALCRTATAGPDAIAGGALQRLEEVLGGTSRGFASEYAWRTTDRERWYAVSVVPLRRAEGGAVVSHVDVTDRKLAEIEIQRTRQELAHFSRVSTLGELAASLAHELNQPLAGILSNAQAARRFLEASPPDVGEVRAIVSDIIDDDRRAGEVIRRMRDMVTPAGSEMVFLDVNTLVRDVAMLVTSDAIIRNVSISFDLAPHAPGVRGNRVELQQVLLNLLVNAMDAVAECPVESRSVIVQTGVTPEGSLLVTVRDAGPGLLPGTEHQIFEPFFTTKPSGMGMGLAIARSIVHGHGGRIGAANDGARGAMFWLTLPVAPERVM